LAAAKGDGKASKLLAASNRDIRELELHGEDLSSALSAAQAELGEAQAAERAALDRQQADRVEELGAQFSMASGRVDDAMEALRAALEARAELGRQLVEALPPAHGRDVSFRVLNPGPIIRAGRAHGLTRWLKLAFFEAHHSRPLAEMHPLPEVDAAVAELRGVAGRSEAA
jgi:hypothetical protein